jgi:hypothetical protein
MPSFCLLNQEYGGALDHGELDRCQVVNGQFLERGSDRPTRFAPANSPPGSAFP